MTLLPSSPPLRVNMINVFFLLPHCTYYIKQSMHCVHILHYNVVNDGAASAGMSINSKIWSFSHIIFLSTTLQGQLKAPTVQYTYRLKGLYIQIWKSTVYILYIYNYTYKIYGWSRLSFSCASFYAWEARSHQKVHSVSRPSPARPTQSFLPSTSFEDPSKCGGILRMCAQLRHWWLG